MSEGLCEPRPGGTRWKGRGVRGHSATCRGTPGHSGSGLRSDSVCRDMIPFGLSWAELWKYILRFSFHFFIYRNIICSGLSQHNKSMERRGITWLYRFQKQKVILHTMNLYTLENLKCQSSWFTYSVSKVTHSLKSTLSLLSLGSNWQNEWTQS